MDIAPVPTGGGQHVVFAGNSTSINVAFHKHISDESRIDFVSHPAWHYVPWTADSYMQRSRNLTHDSSEPRRGKVATVRARHGMSAQDQHK